MPTHPQIENPLDAEQRHLMERFDLSPEKARYLLEYFTHMDKRQATMNSNYQGALTKKDLPAVGYLQHKIEKQLTIDRKAVIFELAALAFSDISNLIEWDEQGITIQKSSDLPAHVKKTVKGLKIREKTDESGNTYRDIEFQFHDKLKALELLGKYVGAFSVLPESMKNLSPNEIKERLKEFVNQAQTMEKKADEKTGMEVPVQGVQT